MKQLSIAPVQQDLVSFMDESRVMLTYIQDGHITEYTYHKNDEVVSVRETIDGEVQEVQLTMSQLVELFNMLVKPAVN